MSLTIEILSTKLMDILYLLIDILSLFSKFFTAISELRYGQFRGIMILKL